MNRLTVRCQWEDRPSLDIAQIGVADGELLLEFTDDYLSSGLDLSPLRLPPVRGLHRHPLRDPFGPLPGLLDDTMPDAWGQRVMDRHLRSQGIVRPTLLQRLAWLGTTTMGALTYHPFTRDPGDPISVDLAKTADTATELITGQPEKVLEVIARAGGSPGGARPKVVIGLDQRSHLITGEATLPEGYEPWMVKFAAPSDREDAGAVEHAYLQMARQAGIVVVDSELLTDGKGRRHVAVRRFDRTDGGTRMARRHMSTVSGLLHADHRLPATDYQTIIRLARRLTYDQRAVEQVFRLAIFNVVAHNRDDHSKNFSFLASADGQWTMAPAYDLTWSLGAGGEHATSVNGRGREIARADLLTLARPAGMPVSDAEDVIDHVCATVARWPELAEQVGLSARRAREIAEDHQLV